MHFTSILDSFRLYCRTSVSKKFDLGSFFRCRSTWSTLVLDDLVLNFDLESIGFHIFNISAHKLCYIITLCVAARLRQP